jgi:hypothetical protein
MNVPKGFLGSNQMVLQLLTPSGSTAVGRPPSAEEIARGVVDTLPAGDLVTSAVCFDVPIFDVRSGRQVGTGTDCLFNINAVGLVVVDDGQGGTVPLPIVRLEAQTTFNLPGGSFTAGGETSVAPITTGLGVNGVDGALTHITGAIPNPASSGNIIEATGAFSGLENSATQARLSGSAGLGNFPTDMAFDCVFVVSKR